jgi:hypothetical protein
MFGAVILPCFHPRLKPKTTSNAARTFAPQNHQYCLSTHAQKVLIHLFVQL